MDITNNIVFVEKLLRYIVFKNYVSHAFFHTRVIKVGPARPKSRPFDTVKNIENSLSDFNEVEIRG